jgi:hypothetical protein
VRADWQKNWQKKLIDSSILAPTDTLNSAQRLIDSSILAPTDTASYAKRRIRSGKNRNPAKLFFQRE